MNRPIAQLEIAINPTAPIVWAHTPVSRQTLDSKRLGVCNSRELFVNRIWG